MIYPINTTYFRMKAEQKRQQEQKRAESVKSALKSLAVAIDTKLNDGYRGVPLEIRFNFIDLGPSDIAPLLQEYNGVWEITNPNPGTYFFVARDSRFVDDTLTNPDQPVKEKGHTLSRMAEIINSLNKQDGYQDPAIFEFIKKNQ